MMIVGGSSASSSSFAPDARGIVVVSCIGDEAKEFGLAEGLRRRGFPASSYADLESGEPFLAAVCGVADLELRADLRSATPLVILAVQRRDVLHTLLELGASAVLPLDASVNLVVGCLRLGLAAPADAIVTDRAFFGSRHVARQAAGCAHRLWSGHS